jgi:hypothetical protein
LLYNYGYVGHELAHAPEFVQLFGGTGCSAYIDINETIHAPDCGFLTLNGTSVLDVLPYSIPLVGLGESYMYGETTDGRVFKAFRIDYCDFGHSQYYENCEFESVGMPQ